MEIQNLVHMANRIGEFFAAMPDRTEAIEGVATHLKKFWEPRMRRAILAHLDSRQGEGLADLVRDALVALRAMLAPAS